MQENLQTVASEFVTMLVTGVLGVLSAFLVALVKKGLDWVSAKIDSIKDDSFRKNLGSALSTLDSIVCTTVTSLQQSLGDEIKKSIEARDGTYTREDLLNLKDKAYELVVNQVNESVTDLLKSTYDDIDALIYDLIENHVRALKGNCYTLSTITSTEECTTHTLLS